MFTLFAVLVFAFLLNQVTSLQRFAICVIALLCAFRPLVVLWCLLVLAVIFLLIHFFYRR